ncbi:uncharacterized protein [Periplaneta americana]|uniref:uncharacterized protein n=1 Tax=Periplaneta americana TaxID=6978 RepID=UPI0037E75AE4
MYISLLGLIQNILRMRSVGKSFALQLNTTLQLLFDGLFGYKLSPAETRVSSRKLVPSIHHFTSNWCWQCNMPRAWFMMALVAAWLLSLSEALYILDHVCLGEGDRCVKNEDCCELLKCFNITKGGSKICAYPRHYGLIAFEVLGGNPPL